MFKDNKKNYFYYIGQISIHWKQRDMIWYDFIQTADLESKNSNKSYLMIPTLFFYPNKVRKASCMSDLSDNN